MASDGLWIEKTYFPRFRKFFEAGELSEDGVRAMAYDDQGAVLAVDRMLEDGEGELTEEVCDRIETELPPGLYQFVKVTNDARKAKVLATIYLRTVDGELDEMWLVRARKRMAPNPLDTFPALPTYVPSSVLADGETSYERRSQDDSDLLPDYMGSQGVEGLRATRHVKVTRRPDFDHLWKLSGWPVRSSKLAPALLGLRINGHRRIPLALLRAAVKHL